MSHTTWNGGLACGGILLALAGLGMGPREVAAGAAATRAPASAALQSVRPLPQIPAYFVQPLGLSPNGRWALFHSYGGGSEGGSLQVADLRGKRHAVTLSYSAGYAFVLDGNSLAFFNYASTLLLRDLVTGRERRLYPRTDKEAEAGAFQSAAGLYGAQAVGSWDAVTGEVRLPASLNKAAPALFALRVRDQRLRPLGKLPQGTLSPDGRRTARTVFERRLPYNTEVTSVRVSQADKERRLAGGQLWGWLDGRTLLTARRTGTENASTLALFRTDAETGRQRFLYESLLGEETSISPSRRWLGAVGGGRFRIVSTEDGRQSAVPAPGVKRFFWGKTDADLFYLDSSGWKRGKLVPGKGGPPAAPPAAPPVPDQVAIPMSPETAFRWETVAPYSGPWQVYLAAPHAVTAAKVGDETWIGTTQGLRVLDARDHAKPLLPWQEALRGRRVDAIAVDGERAWLAVRRHAPFNSGAEFESTVVRVDRRTGWAEQRFLQANGFGDSDYVRAILPGPRLLALGAAYRQVEVWDDHGSRYAASPQMPANRFSGLCAADGTGGSVWIGGFDGLYRWRPEAGTAEHWTETHGLPSLVVLSVVEADGRAWVGTAAGLVVVDVRTGQVTPPTGETVGDEPVVQLLETPGAIYAVTRRAVSRYDRTSRAWRRRPLPSELDGSLAWDGRRLVGAFGPAGALLASDAQGGWREIWRGAGRGPAESPVAKLLWSTGTLWCGHERSLSALRPESGDWKSYRLPAGVRGVTGLAMEENNLLVSAQRGGVIQLDPKTGAMRRWLETLPDYSTPEKPYGPSVEAALMDARYVYVVADEGLYRIDRLSGARRRLSLDEQPDRGGFASATLVLREPHSIVLAAEGSQQERLLRITLPDLRPAPLPDPGGLANGTPFALEEGRGFWLPADGVKLVNLEGQVLASYPQPRRFRNQSLEAMAWSPGYLWQARAGQPPEKPFETLVARIDLNAGGEWQELPPCPLSGVRQLLVAGGSLWAATANGLARLPLGQVRPVALRDPDRAPYPPEREIFLALGHRDFEEVKGLLAAGLSPDVAFPARGQTPLMEAAAMGWLEMVAYLLDRGANVNVADLDGETALWRARDLKTARLLLDRGADPNTRDGKDHSGYPLLINKLTQDLNPAMVRLLIEKGADVNLREELFGLTPLAAAVQFAGEDSEGLVRLLLGRGARINVADNDGNTPLMHSLVTGREEVFRLLLDRGADVKTANKLGDTALHLAVQQYRRDAIPLLLARHAELEAVGGHGWTPLLAAAAAADFEAVALLINAGANVNARSKTGQTALMFAAGRDAAGTVKLLLDHGARVSAKDQEGRTALSFAAPKGEVARLLRAAGKKQ